jgi:hypothetical protein
LLPVGRDGRRARIELRHVEVLVRDRGYPGGRAGA